MHILSTKMSTSLVASKTKHLMGEGDIFAFIVITDERASFGTLQVTSLEAKTGFIVEPVFQTDGSNHWTKFWSNPQAHVVGHKVDQLDRYVREVADEAVRIFFNPNQKISLVSGIILAGDRALKKRLASSKQFNRSPCDRVITATDIQCLSEKVFNEAVKKSAHLLRKTRSRTAELWLDRFFTEAKQDLGRFCFGIEDTVRALKEKSVQTIIVCHRYNLQEFELLLPNGQLEAVYLSSDEWNKRQDNMKMRYWTPFPAWLEDSGVHFELVSISSKRGNIFLQDFGGIGCLLRHRNNSGNRKLSELCKDKSSNNRIVQEKELLARFFSGVL